MIVMSPIRGRAAVQSRRCACSIRICWVLPEIECRFESRNGGNRLLFEFRGRNESRDEDLVTLPIPLIREKEEKTISVNWSAERPTKLIKPHDRTRGRRCIPRVENIILDILEQRSVILVRTAPADDVEVSAVSTRRLR